MLERVEGELFAFTEAMKKSPGFQYFLKNPTVSRGDKVKEVLFSSTFYYFPFLKELLILADVHCVNPTNMTIIAIRITQFE